LKDSFRESEKTFRELLLQVPVSIIYLNREGKINFINSEASQMLKDLELHKP
jgi:PAS domain-containing protein